MLGTLIAAGTSLLGGILGRKSQEKANAQNIALQKQFAQEGIQWKVADAVKAGVHPLYALGAQTHSFAPTVVGDTSLSTGLQNMGQDISRAMDATAPASRKATALNATIEGLNLERLGLENELLRSQINATRQAGGSPGIPTGPAINVAGVPIGPNASWSDTQDATNRWGELADWIYGPFVMGADARQAVGERMKSPEVPAWYRWLLNK